MSNQKNGKGIVIATLLAVALFGAGIAVNTVNGKELPKEEEVSFEASVESSAEVSVEESVAEATEVTEGASEATAEEDEKYFVPTVDENENLLEYQLEELEFYGADEKYIELAQMDITQGLTYFSDFLDLYREGDPALMDYVSFGEDDETEGGEESYDKKKWRQFFESEGTAEAWKIITDDVQIRIDPSIPEEDYAKQPLFIFHLDDDNQVKEIEINWELEISVKNFYKAQYVESAHLRPDISTYKSYDAVLEELRWVDEKIRPDYIQLFSYFKISTDDLTYTATSAFISGVYGYDDPETYIDHDYIALGQTIHVCALLDHTLTPDRDDLIEITKDVTVADKIQPYVTMSVLCQEGKYAEAMNYAIESGIHFYINYAEKYEAMPADQQAEVDQIMAELGTPVFSAFYDEKEEKLHLVGYAYSLHDNGNGTYEITTERFTTSYATGMTLHCNEMFRDIFEPFSNAVNFVEAQHK